MTKNELIEKLQSIEGNPVVLLSGEGSVFFCIERCKAGEDAPIKK